jgi:hypothetical protein
MGKMKRVLSWLITGFGGIAIVFIPYYIGRMGMMLFGATRGFESGILYWLFGVALMLLCFCFLIALLTIYSFVALILDGEERKEEEDESI